MWMQALMQACVLEMVWLVKKGKTRSNFDHFGIKDSTIDAIEGLLWANVLNLKAQTTGKMIDPKDAMQNVLSGFWSQHFVKPKDRGVYRSVIYNFYRLIYNENDQVVKNFFVCPVCDIISHLNVSTHAN